MPRGRPPKPKPIPPTPGQYDVGDLVEHVKPCPSYATGKFKVMEIRENKRGEKETSVYGGDGYKNMVGAKSKGDGIYAGWRTFLTEQLVKTI